jgi:hypothetical protein
MKTVSQRILKLLGGLTFFIQGPSDLDLWPSDLKISRGHLLVITKLNIKYEDCWLKHSQAIERTSFFNSRPTWPQNQMGSPNGHDQPSCQIWRLWVKGFLGYWADKLFEVKVSVTLTLNLKVKVMYGSRSSTVWSTWKSSSKGCCLQLWSQSIMK